MATHTRPEPILLWLRAETFIHVGTGQQADVIDLPFAREGATGYPYIPGSGMKGALRDAYWFTTGQRDRDKATQAVFGKEDSAGTVLVSDARLAFLPVRSLAATYRYVTSPSLLRRIQHDLDFSSLGKVEWRPPTLTFDGGSTQYYGSAPTAGARTLYLEEFPFDCQGGHGIGSIPGLPEGDFAIVDRLLAVLDDTDFDHFARHGLHVRTRNKLDPDTKTVGDGLWNEESLPPDTLLYVVLSARMPEFGSDAKDHAGELAEILMNAAGGFFQVGGNETVGEGWLRVLGATRARWPAAGGPVR